MPKVTGIPEIRFNLNEVKDRNKPTLILAVFRYTSKDGPQRLLYSTRLKIEPKHWVKQQYRPRPNYELYSHYTSILNEVASSIRSIYLSLPENQLPSTEEFKKELDFRLNRELRPIQENSVPDLLSFALAYSEQRKAAQGAKPGTWKKFFTVTNHLNEYASQHSNGVLNYEDLDWNWRDSFLNWLYKAPRNHSINNAAKIVGIIKQFLNEARKRGYHNNLIFQERDFGVQRKSMKHISLDFARLKTLSDLDLTENPRLARVRDLFLIGAYSGLRISDFKRLKPEHFVTEGKHEMIHINTKKTNTDVYVPLFPDLKAILERYNYSSPPSISDQKMNEYLKELCQLSGMVDEVMYTYSKGGKILEEKFPRWMLITSHTARRSFATNFYELGIPAAHLMAITGHATEKQFFGYINVNKKKLAQNMAMIAAELLSER